jgi:xylan 1,4-beta-xylosidase
MPVLNRAVPHGLALSDDFSRNKMGIQWGFYNPTPRDTPRFAYRDGGHWQ